MIDHRSAEGLEDWDGREDPLRHASRATSPGGPVEERRLEVVGEGGADVVVGGWVGGEGA